MQPWATVSKKRTNGTYRVRWGEGPTVLGSKVTKTKAEANAVRDQRVHELRSGTYVSPRDGEVTFAVYAEQWLTAKESEGLTAATMANIRTRIRKHAVPYFGKRQMASIRAQDVKGYRTALLAKGIASSTAKSIMQTTGQVFIEAVTDRRIPRNVFDDVALPGGGVIEVQHFLDPAQTGALAGALADERYRAAVFLAAYGGLRAGELWALTVRDVQFLKATVLVNKSVSEKGGWHVKTTKTERVRSLVIPRFLVEMLAAHVAAGYSDGSEGLLFTAAEGGPVMHRNFMGRHFYPAVRKLVKEAKNAADRGEPVPVTVPADLRFHDLRHTCAAFLIDSGRHMEEVKDYLGHASIRTTSDRYGHIFPKAKQSLADALDALYADSSGAIH